MLLKTVRIIYAACSLVIILFLLFSCEELEEILYNAFIKEKAKKRVEGSESRSSRETVLKSK